MTRKSPKDAAAGRPTPKTRRFVGRSAGLERSARPPQQGRAADGRLSYHAIVMNAARPVDDLPESERPDNLILASAWESGDIRVEIQGINGGEDGLPVFIGNETVHLFVGDYEATPVDVRPSIEGDPFSDLVPDPVSFTLPKASLPGSDYRSFEMHYQIDYAEGSDNGPDQRISVDDVKPSPTTPAPLQFDIVGDTITPHSFKTEAGKEFIEATLPAYVGMKPGDIIRLYIGTIEDTVDDDITEVPWDYHGPVTVRFSRAFIETFSDGMFDFQYAIEGREGLRSDLSTAVRLRVLIENYLEDLSEPGVKAYDEDTGVRTVDEQDARENLEVTIPLHAKVTTEHSVVIHWGFATTTRVPVTNPSNIRIIVPYSAIQFDWIAKRPLPEEDASVQVDVSYNIFKGTLLVGTSPPHTVEVNLHLAGGDDPSPGTDPNENLVKPIVRPGVSGADYDNTIPLTDSDFDANVLISKKRQDGKDVFIVGDRVTVHYAGRTLAPYTITADDLATPATPLSIILPANDIQAGGAGLKDASYWIERALGSGGANTSKSPIQPIQVATRDALPGKGILEEAILPEMFGSTLGMLSLLDGTPVGIPDYQLYEQDDVIEFFAAMFLGRTHTDPETPVEGFGAEDYHADQNNRFTLVSSDKAMRDPDRGEIDEPGGGTRPPIAQKHILFRIPKERFPDVGDNGLAVYHVHFYYRITNKVGTVTSKQFQVLVDPRGTPPGESDDATHGLAGQLAGFATKLRHIESLIQRWLRRA
jgi:hypothetical protein